MLFCRMISVLPQAFYENTEFQKVFCDGLSGVVLKKIKRTEQQKEEYLSVHALLIVLHGRSKVENDDYGSHMVNANQMIFLRKGLYKVSDIVIDKQPFIAIVFFFDEPLIIQFLASLSEKSEHVKFNADPVFTYADTFKVFTETLLKLYHNGDQRHYKVTKLKLLEMLHLLSTGEACEAFIQTILSLNNNKKKSINDFMKENFYKPLTVEDF